VIIFLSLIALWGEATKIVTVFVGLGALAAFTSQPVTMWRNNSRGDVSLKSMLTMVVIQFIWIFYGFSIQDYFLGFASSVVAVFPVAVTIVYLKVGPKKVGTA
jgi:uncharacterized protein with PQ loop repeat